MWETFLPCPLNETVEIIENIDDLSLSTNFILHEKFVVLVIAMKGKMRVNSFPDGMQEHMSGRHFPFIWVHFPVTILYLILSTDLSSIRNSAWCPWGVLQETHIRVTLCNLEECNNDNVRSVAERIPFKI